MRAQILKEIKKPLILEEVSQPSPGDNEVLIKVDVCGVCRTDLHIIDGELPFPKLPLILGHQIIGTIEKVGPKVLNYKKGEKVGVPWLAKTCGECFYCLKNKENLCEKALFTGYTTDGGFAEYCVAHSQYIFPISNTFSPLYTAPFLCAGMIGYRALKIVKEAKKIGFYGFGSSAHLLIQVALAQHKEVFVFTRPHDIEGQQFAKKCGAKWVGASDMLPSELLDAVIIFAPVGSLIPQALKTLRKGGVVVCAGIHMSDIPTFPYDLLWGERVITTVANLTREDGQEFLSLANQIPIYSMPNAYPLEKINQAFDDMRIGKLNGSAVIMIQ